MIFHTVQVLQQTHLSEIRQFEGDPAMGSIPVGWEGFLKPPKSLEASEPREKRLLKTIQHNYIPKKNIPKQ